MKLEDFYFYSLAILNILSSTWSQGSGFGTCQSAISGAGRDGFITGWLRDFSSPMERQFCRRQRAERHLESQFCVYARGVEVTEGVSAGEGVIISGARLD